MIEPETKGFGLELLGQLGGDHGDGESGVQPPLERLGVVDAQLAALVRSGREPDEIAEKTMRGIRDNELYIFTHPELRSILEDRFQRILAAYPKI